MRVPCPSRSAPHHCSASQIDGRPKLSPAWIVAWKFSRWISWNASRCRVGGKPASGPAMSKPTTPSSRCRTASSAASTERAAWRIAETSSFIAIRRPSLPRSLLALAEAGEDRRHRLVEREPAFGRELGRVPHLGVHDAVGGEVFGALGRDALDRVARLEQGDRVAEPLEVELEALAVGAAQEPAGELGRVARGQLGIADRRRRARSRSRAAAHRRGGRAEAPSAPRGSFRPRASRLSADPTRLEPPAGALYLRRGE